MGLVCGQDWRTFHFWTLRHQGYANKKESSREGVEPHVRLWHPFTPPLVSLPAQHEGQASPRIPGSTLRSSTQHARSAYARAGQSFRTWRIGGACVWTESTNLGCSQNSPLLRRLVGLCTPASMWSN
jgi:hypothetical protein